MPVPFDASLLPADPHRLYSLQPSLDAAVAVWSGRERFEGDTDDTHALALVRLGSSAPDGAAEMPDGTAGGPSADIFVTPTNTHFRMDSDGGSTVLAFVFDEQLSHFSPVPLLARAEGRRRLRAGARSSSPIVLAIARSIGAALEAGESVGRSTLNALVVALLEALSTDPTLTDHHESVSAFAESCVDRACAAIDRNICGEIRLAEVAREAGVSPYHLSRCFAVSMGETLSDYVRKRRLQAACRRLIETRDSLSEVAYECGYSSQSAMNAAFRRLLDKTPLDYRRSVWDGGAADLTANAPIPYVIRASKAAARHGRGAVMAVDVI